jgi:hypothetical protein
MTSDVSDGMKIEPSASVRRSMIEEPEVLSEESSGALESIPPFVAPLVVTGAVFVGVLVLYKTWRESR